MNVSYYDLFERNMGVFTQKDQERIREAKIMIIGVGGMGGTVAVLLARTGFTKFYLIDPETYELSNMNRQIGCFIDTIGKYKVEVIKNDILRINPEAQVIGDSKKLSLPEIEKTIKEWCPDVVIAEADDVAFSAKVIRIATSNGIYAITGMPSGFTGYVIAFRLLCKPRLRRKRYTKVRRTPKSRTSRRRPSTKQNKKEIKNIFYFYDFSRVILCLLLVETFYPFLGKQPYLLV